MKPANSQHNHEPYLMKIKQGERLHKLFFFRPIIGKHKHFEYRILTKERTNGTLEMVSYNFKIVDGIPQKSGITRVPEISKKQLDNIVQNIVRSTQTRPNEFEELDLSKFATIDEQLEFLKRQDCVDAIYSM